jgi:hypothetical protein
MARAVAGGIVARLCARLIWASFMRHETGNVPEWLPPVRR